MCWEEKGRGKISLCKTATVVMSGEPVADREITVSLSLSHGSDCIFRSATSDSPVRSVPRGCSPGVLRGAVQLPGDRSLGKDVGIPFSALAKPRHMILWFEARRGSFFCSMSGPPVQLHL